MKRTTAFIVIILLCSCAFASFRVTDCTVNIQVGQNAVHHVEEWYTVNFLSAHHGIERFIPIDYSSIGTHANISNVTCNQPFTSFEEDGCYVMRIGDSSKLLTGSVEYCISYDLDTGADNFDGVDYFIFNIVGTEWECSFDNVNFSVTIPASLTEDQISLYVGDYGSTDQCSYIVEKDNLNTVITGTVKNLDQYQGITIEADLYDGFYIGARQAWDYRSMFSVLNPVCCIILLALAGFIWLLVGRDNVPIVSARFEVPDDMTPMEIGYLVDEKVEDRDITAMLYYWADKGYLTINEKKKNKFIFTKIADLPLDVPAYERKLFYGFFKKDSMQIEDLRETNFYQTMQEIKVIVPRKVCNGTRLVSTKSIVFAVVFSIFGIFAPGLLLGLQTACSEFTTDLIFMPFTIMIILGAIELILFFALFKKWYVRRTNFFSIGLIVLVFSVFAFFLCLEISNTFGTVNLIQVGTSMLCQLFIIMFAAIMPRRTQYGHRIFEEVLGFREFIDKVSMSELVLMIDKDPCYYYHILSYAIVLHLEDKWAEKFKSVAVPPPVWYVGRSQLNYLYWNRMFVKMNNAFVAAVPRQKNGGGNIHVGSSFNFGGFSGGGGHAW